MVETNESSADRLDSSGKLSGPPVVDAELVDQLPVTLEVRIGSVALPLTELQQIAPGAILTLEEYSANQVEILAREKTIARGEIVTVDDRLAVRILQILDPEPTGEE